MDGRIKIDAGMDDDYDFIWWLTYYVDNYNNWILARMGCVGARDASALFYEAGISGVPDW